VQEQAKKASKKTSYSDIHESEKSQVANSSHLARSTTVQNVKVEFIRPRYTDLKAWCADPNNVYIGRRGVVFVDKVRFPDRESTWANPFKLSKTCSRDESIRKYEAHIRKRLAAEAGLLDALRALRGKALGCWCKPEACHGDILLRLLAEDERHTAASGEDGSKADD
jgi:hypothetical protein